MNRAFRYNNFDLIRLIAAVQVAYCHSLGHLKVEHTSFLTEIVALIPGVPISFFVSGYLISKSYENNSLLREYAQNRILRIYPALIACTFVAVLSVFLSGYFAHRAINVFHFIAWIAGQITFVQFYNPDFMREFGTGVLNGSLWTITVELQFYVLVPLIYWVFGLKSKSRTRQNIILAVLVFVFMAINIVHSKLNGYRDTLPFKLWDVSFLPWFYMFLVGVVVQKNFEQIYRLLRGKVLLFLLTYLFATYLTCNYFGWHVGNDIGPLLFFLLVLMVFSFAYSFPTLSGSMLRKNDISYGVYIYHMPVVNLFIYYGYTSNGWLAALVVLLTIIAASISWKLVEQHALKLKKHPLNPFQANKSFQPTGEAHR